MRGHHHDVAIWHIDMPAGSCSCCNISFGSDKKPTQDAALRIFGRFTHLGVTKMPARIGEW